MPEPRSSNGNECIYIRLLYHRAQALSWTSPYIQVNRGLTHGLRIERESPQLLANFAERTGESIHSAEL